MSPLALGLGAGSEMLQPLAVCMVFGLLFSMFVSLLLIPSIYLLLQPRAARNAPAPAEGGAASAAAQGR
jgi:multidrug efflux pump subunit AcrB